MGVRGRIAAKAQLKLIEFQRENIIGNMPSRSRFRRPKVDLRETVAKQNPPRYASEMTKLSEKYVFPRFVRRPVDTNRLKSFRRPEVDLRETVAKQNPPKYASETTKLSEKFVFPRFVKRPVDTNILAQTRGIIETRISGGKLEVKWYKNGLLIIDSARIKIHHYEPDIYVLEIRDALMSDMGTYTCIARNCYGSITSSVTIRIVHSKIEECPRFFKRLQSTDVFTGHNTCLEVTVTGVPKPDVKWFKNWVLLREDNRIKIRHYEPDTYVLYINNVTPEDVGLYTCKARNDVGVRSTSAMVYVEGNKNLLIYKPLARLPNEFVRDNEWSEDLTHISRQLERLEASQKEKNDLWHRNVIANLSSKISSTKL